MKFSRPPKSQLLNRFVKSIWVYKSEPEKGSEKILPTTGGQFLVNLDGLKLSHRHVKGTLMRKIGPVGLQGALTEPVLIEKEQKAKICGVKFLADGLSAFTDKHAICFVDQLFNAEEIWGPSVSELYKSLRSENDPERQCDQIEALLLQRVRPRPNEDEVLQLYLSALASGASVAEIQKIAGISQRKLHNLFDRRIGIRPKLFARIERFSKSLPDITNNSSLSDIAYSRGYSDQAHYTREFRRFAANSPRSTVFVDGELHHTDIVLNNLFKTKVAR